MPRSVIEGPRGAPERIFSMSSGVKYIKQALGKILSTSGIPSVLFPFIGGVIGGSPEGAHEVRVGQRRSCRLQGKPKKGEIDGPVSRGGLERLL
jgi:hypothetical protein